VDILDRLLGHAIAHLVTHSMHHRAQVLNIMRHLGVTDLIEGDVLGWEAAHASRDRGGSAPDRGATTGSGGGRVLLRAVADEDLPIFFEQQRNPEANRMAAFTARDPSDRQAFEAHWAQIRGDGGVTIRTILFAGRVAGHVAIYGPPGEREVTYWLGREYWGRGIATEALSQLLREQPERPLCGRAVADNLASLRVLAKCGFVVSGRDRSFANARGEEVEEVTLTLDAEGRR
jgi:RimJ/RimL family protein N-acetyltransferase